MVQQRLKKIELTGNSHERGLQHGRALKDWIYEAIDRTKYMLSKSLKMSSGRILSNFKKDNEYLSEVKKWTPEILKEVEGIADGADLDFNELFAYQCAEEILLVLPYEKKGNIFEHHCSSLGCNPTPETSAFIGQNLDWSSVYEGFNTLLVIHGQSSNHNSFINTYPGLIAVNGMNDSPLAVCVNSLQFVLNCSPRGLPVAFIVRELLEKSHVDEAIGFLTEIDHASAENYLIGGIDRVVDFECSKNAKVQYIQEDNPDRVFHTNHPEVNKDCRIPPLDYTSNLNTLARLDYMKYRMEASKPFKLEHAKLLLSSFFESICRINSGTDSGLMTLFSSIFHLTDQPEMYLTQGPPCQFPYEVFRFNGDDV